MRFVLQTSVILFALLAFCFAVIEVWQYYKEREGIDSTFLITVPILFLKSLSGPFLFSFIAAFPSLFVYWFITIVWTIALYVFTKQPSFRDAFRGAVDDLRYLIVVFLIGAMVAGFTYYAIKELGEGE